MSEQSSESVFMYFPSNRGWSHQLIRIIGESSNGGGDFGEINRAASKMIVGDSESWFKEWNAIAEYVENLAKSAEKRGFKESAKQAYFRASNYYRMADFYLGRNDQREKVTYRKHVHNFEKAASLNGGITPVSIPFEGKKLHAYFVSKQSKKLPCVVIFGGADATCEEVYFNSAIDCIKRGMHALIIDGPGQGYTLRFEKLYARPDYEKVVAAAINFLTKNYSKLVDSKRIGIMGRSMGGYYSSRAASKEKRVKAAVVFDAIFNIREDVYDFFPPVRPAINWDLGARDEQEAIQKLKDFDLSGVVENVSCPILIVHGTEDYVSSPKAAEKLYKSVGWKDKTLKLYKAGHGAAAYRAESTSYVFDWLSKKLTGSTHLS
ncbi:MAG: alpha/beta hydrolase [Thaumarchaeota archaeon]|nr:alpha/beta hydrolase [Nitrososphaerota archaeon]